MYNGMISNKGRMGLIVRHFTDHDINYSHFGKAEKMEVKRSKPCGMDKNLFILGVQSQQVVTEAGGAQ